MPVLPLVALILGCASQPATLESVPAAPTVDLEKKEETVTWSTLPGLLPEGEPALPAALGELKLGQTEAEARAAWEKVRHAKLKPPPDKAIEQYLVLGGRLQAFPTVGATLLIDESGLDAIDLTVPRAEAKFLCTQAWGQPDGQEEKAVGVPNPVWTHDGLKVVLIEIDEDQAILKFAADED